LSGRTIAGSLQQRRDAGTGPEGHRQEEALRKDCHNGHCHNGHCRAATRKGSGKSKFKSCYDVAGKEENGLLGLRSRNWPREAIRIKV
jgi:hypothetical protein